MSIATHESALAALDAALARARKSILRPPPRLTIPEWADQHRYLSTSVGAIGGRWSTARVEVARGPSLAVTEPGVRTLTVQCCTQLMKTSLIENIFGYFAHLDPCPILLLQPKDESVEAFSKERIAPMVASTPVLRELMGAKNTRDGDDTLKYKKFPGGYLAMVSSGSPTNFAMRAIRIVLQDEIDKYEPTKEGDPLMLAEERMSTFKDTSLSVRACSPTWVETSRIHKSYLSGDQRKPFCQCPHCQEWISLDFFKHVHWEKDEDGQHIPETAVIICDKCGSEWSEAERLRMCSTDGAIWHLQSKEFTCCGEKQSPEENAAAIGSDKAWEWVDKHRVGYAVCKHCGKRAVPNEHASFKASKLYSPFTSTRALARKFVDSKDDPESKQAFVNTQLGEPFKAETQKEVASHHLASRRETYQAPVPRGGLVLTAGVDVQPDGQTGQGRLEVEIVAWGLYEESWSVGIHTLRGDPAAPQVWEDLDKLLQTPLRSERGFDMYISGVCVDSGGHNTSDVYRYCRARVGRNIWAIKGASDASGQWSPIWPSAIQERKRQKYRAGYKPVIIGVNAAKEAIRQRLLVNQPGPSYCHFPADRPDWWFDQLTSEELRIEVKGGARVRYWAKKKGVANEGLDTRVYAYAALHGLYHTRRLEMEKLAAALDSYGRPGAAKEPARKVVTRRRRRQN